MRKNKAVTAAQEQKLLAALAEHFTGSAVLTLNGVAYKAKDLQKQIQAHLDAMSAADALRAKWQTAVVSANAADATVMGILPALRTHLISQFGDTSQTVRDFGFTPKTRSTTVAAQAEGIAKREATRAARGTKGKKQKEAIVGSVAPATASEAPAPKAAPASAPTAGGATASSASA